MPEADAVVVMVQMQATLVTAGTLTILKQAATSRRVVPTPNAVAVVAVADRAQVLHRAPRAVLQARLPRLTSNSAIGALRSGTL